MLLSKNKASCSYSNNKSTNKTKPKPTASSLLNQTQQQNHLKEGLYEELMNQLQIQDSQYIGKLIRKNDRKIDKTKTLKSKNKADDTPLSNLHGHQTINRSSSQSTPSKHFNSPDKQACFLTQETAKQLPHRQNSQAYLCSLKNQQDNYFLNDLDAYLCTLNTHSKTQAFSRKLYRNQRQFRKTIDISEKINYEPTISIPVAKYEKLLTKLSQSLLKNDKLESALQASDQKMGEMKHIIKSMYLQIHELSSQLQQEKVQKEQYSYMLEQFASKVRSVRHSSKEKPYLPTHVKRNSCVPSTLNQYSCQNYFNNTDLNRIFYDNTNKYDLKKKETAHLKKKSNLHKNNRINQDYVDSTEGRMSCDSASIYNDRSSILQRN